MRLLIKKGDMYAEAFRVNFYKSKNWSVIGEHLLFDYLKELIPQSSKFHSHFIYVDTGDYHFSMKYFDNLENQYFDRKTYYNHIAIRKGPTAEFSKDVPYERRDRNLDDPLDCFMMGERLKPWSDKEIGHQFGNIALNMSVAKWSSLPWAKDISPSNDDLVIDLDMITGNVANLAVSLFHKDNENFNAMKLPEEVVYIEKSITKDDLILRLHIIIA